MAEYEETEIYETNRRADGDAAGFALAILLGVPMCIFTAAGALLLWGPLGTLRVGIGAWNVFLSSFH